MHIRQINKKQKLFFLINMVSGRLWHVFSIYMKGFSVCFSCGFATFGIEVY